MWCLKNFLCILVVVVVLCDIPFVTSLSTSSSDERLVELNQPDASYQLRLLPSKLISPVQALKLNRYQSPRTAAAKKLKIQVPIINSKHKLKYHGRAMDISQIQPEIEVPSSRTTPLSLIFKFSSSPLNIEQRHLKQSQNLLLLDSNGIDDLRKSKFPIHYSANGMPLIQSDSKILQTINGNRYGYYQQPRFETIEQMIGAQDMSYLYEPLLLNSLAEKLSTQESTIATLYAINNNNNNNNNDQDNNQDKLSSTTLLKELPITLTNTYSHDNNNNFDQQFLLNYLSRMATTVKPQQQQQQNYLIDNTTPQIIPSMDLTIFHFKNEDNPIINQLSATIKK